MFSSFEQSNPAHLPEGLGFVTVRSAALGRRADLTLYCPPDARGLRNIPLILLLHGIYGSHWAWAFSGGVHRSLARLVGEGCVPPMALCMPSDGLWGDGSGYVRHDGQDFERWVVDEAPAAARRALPAVGAASPLCIAGLSMGGYAALRLAALHPGKFRAASGHSSVTDPEQLGPWMQEPPAAWCIGAEQARLDAVLRSAPVLPPLRFDCGIEDPLLEANRELHRALEEAQIPHRYEEFPGGHTWDYWSEHVARSLIYFAAVLAGPT